MKRLSRVLLAVGLSLLLVNALWGQGFSVQLTCTDGTTLDTLILGAHPDAHWTISPEDTLAFGEQELPPDPVDGAFDVRLIGSPGHSTDLGAGSQIDYQPLGAVTETHKWRGTWQPEAPPATQALTITWPAGLGSVGGGYWHLTSNDDVDIDMTTTTTVTLDADHGSFLVTGGDSLRFTTFTYQRFWQDKNYKGQIGKSNPRSTKAFYWPTIANVGEEIDKLAAGSITIGSSSTQAVLLKKFGDMVKNSYVAKTGVSHSPDSIFCLAYLPHSAKGKSYAGFDAPDPKNTGKLAKIQSKLDPTPGKAMQSYLFAQIMALEFNLKASGVKTPAGLGTLVINDDSPFNGMTISQLRDAGDQAFSCVAPTGYTLKEITDKLEAVNKAFNKSAYMGYTVDTAHIDTLAGVIWHASIVGGKPKAAAKLTLKCDGWISLANVSWLKRGGAIEAPVTTPIAEVENAQPEAYRLDQNYPNPFNPQTNINLNLVEDGLVTVKVFNMLGQEVATLADREEMFAGENELSFDGSQLSSGVYLYRVTVNNVESGKVVFQETKKMMLVK